MAELKSLYGSAIAVGIMIAGALIGLQIIGWLGGMLIWPVAWCLFFTGMGDIFPKSPSQQMLVRLAIGVAIAGVLVVKMSLSQRKRG